MVFAQQWVQMQARVSTEFREADLQWYDIF